MATQEPTSANKKPLSEDELRAQVEKKLLTEEELRVALNLPNVHAVRELRHKRKIPFVRLGYRTIRYNEAKVLAALEKLTVQEAGAARS